MTLAKLAQKVELSIQSLTAYENHRTTPSPTTVTSLAAALQYPATFFEQPPVQVELDSTSLRAPSKMSAADRDSALSSAAIAIALNTWLEGLFKLPKSSLPTYPHLAPEDAAEAVRAAWGLGEAPLPNSVHLLESHGVRVSSLPTDCLKSNTFSAIHMGTPYLFLNTRKNREQGRFDTAHELGHLVLHCEYRIPHGRQAEEEANDFASAFLMPRAGILAQSLHNASLDRVLNAKRKWGVSALALAYRMRKLELLSEWRHRQIVKELHQQDSRHEPGCPPGREGSQVLVKAFEALRQSTRTSPADVAAKLGLHPEDLAEYMFGLAPTGLVGGGERSTSRRRPALRVVS